MESIKIMPCLDMKEGRVVKGIHFVDLRDAGDPVENAQFYEKEGADELAMLDIAATVENRKTRLEWVKNVSSVISIPLTVGGGIGSVEDMESVLEAGADKISINSPALADPDLIGVLAHRFGSQCVVIGVDSMERDAEYDVYQYTGDPHRSRSTARRTIDWVQEVQQRGAGEIVLNCMNQDGVRKGYDLAQLERVRAACGVPLIASGGAGEMEHFREAFTPELIFISMNQVS